MEQPANKYLRASFCAAHLVQQLLQLHIEQLLSLSRRLRLLCGQTTPSHTSSAADTMTVTLLQELARGILTQDSNRQGEALAQHAIACSDASPADAGALYNAALCAPVLARTRHYELHMKKHQIVCVCNVPRGEGAKQYSSPPPDARSAISGFQEQRGPHAAWQDQRATGSQSLCTRP